MDYVLWSFVKDICVVYVDDLVSFAKHKNNFSTPASLPAASPTLWYVRVGGEKCLLLDIIKLVTSFVL